MLIGSFPIIYFHCINPDIIFLFILIESYYPKIAANTKVNAGIKLLIAVAAVEDA